MISISVGRNISLMRKRKKQNEEKSKILQKKNLREINNCFNRNTFFLEMKNIKNLDKTFAN